MLHASIESGVLAFASSTPQHAPTKRNYSLTTQELPAYWHFHWHCGGGSLALLLALLARLERCTDVACTLVSTGYSPCGATITLTTNPWPFVETSFSNATGFLQNPPGSKTKQTSV
jgi:hypothetical protein